MRIRGLLTLIASATLLWACNGKEAPVQDANTTTYKVAVIMPQSIWESVKPIAQQALQNIATAQEGLQDRVALELEWVDEDAANLGSEVTRVTHDDSYAAIIGPKYSRHARQVARESLSYRIPVLMPSVTSAEIQRIYAGSNKSAPNIFCMTESDLAQCQALLSVISRQMWCSRVLLMSRQDDSDDYVTSFNAYLPFLATELDFAKIETYPFTDKESMREQVRAINQLGTLTTFISGLFFVPSTAQDMLWLDEILSEEGIVQDEGVNFPRIYCPDMASSDYLEERLQHEYEGIALCGSPESGFPAMRKALSGKEIQSGYAQLYDCFTLLGLALAHKETAGKETVREAIVDVMDACDGGSGNKLGWTAEALSDGFHAIRNGRIPNMAGASGSWIFDKETHISQLGSWYGHWRFYDGAYHFVQYLTRSDYANQASMDQIWNQTAGNRGWEIPISDKDFEYEPLQERYAVVMATSTGFTNYRHQADALDVYRMLRDAGYQDDHIILITEDDIAGNESNPHPGVVHVTPDGENLHDDVQNNYKISQLTPEDLANILKGTVTTRTPWVVKGGKNTNVFFFWSGHGKFDGMLNWGSGEITAGEVRAALSGAQDNFRKMMLVMETCYSGSVGEYCTGIPGLLILTAAAPGEKSHADVLEGNIYLSNAFTRVFREEVEKNPDISIYDLYTELARHTTASHAMIYNYDWYGSVYDNTMAEYFKPLNNQ
ncbi:MAG: hypothetical protein IKG92_00975 [Bacteroidales bacterium]|nr:hypothetical protein [Bacteroidales bacterium]